MLLLVLLLGSDVAMLLLMERSLAWLMTTLLLGGQAEDQGLNKIILNVCFCESDSVPENGINSTTCA